MYLCWRVITRKLSGHFEIVQQPEHVVLHVPGWWGRADNDGNTQWHPRCCSCQRCVCQCSLCALQSYQEINVYLLCWEVTTCLKIHSSDIGCHCCSTQIESHNKEFSGTVSNIMRFQHIVTITWRWTLVSKLRKSQKGTGSARRTTCHGNFHIREPCQVILLMGRRTFSGKRDSWTAYIQKLWFIWWTS